MAAWPWDASQEKPFLTTAAWKCLGQEAWGKEGGATMYLLVPPSVSPGQKSLHPPVVLISY